MKLANISMIRATLRCESGLHIGGGNTEMHIGGIDNTVVRNPATNRPYVPGSSIKGKIRSLLEWRSGEVRQGPMGWADYERSENPEVLRILQLFGCGGGDQLTVDQAQRLGPTRLSFWDCELRDEWCVGMDEANQLLTEAKSENSINRITGTADNPRFTERVVAGAVFDFRLSMKQLDSDDRSLLDTVFAGMKLLELDSLGGSGSRGYGKVKFINVTVDGADRQKEFDETDPFKIR